MSTCWLNLANVNKGSRNAQHGAGSKSSPWVSRRHDDGGRVLRAVCTPDGEVPGSLKLACRPERQGEMQLADRTQKLLRCLCSSTNNNKVKNEESRLSPPALPPVHSSLLRHPPHPGALRPQHHRSASPQAAVTRNPTFRHHTRRQRRPLHPSALAETQVLVVRQSTPPEHCYHSPSRFPRSTFFYLASLHRLSNCPIFHRSPLLSLAAIPQRESADQRPVCQSRKLCTTACSALNNRLLACSAV